MYTRNLVRWQKRVIMPFRPLITPSPHIKPSHQNSILKLLPSWNAFFQAYALVAFRNFSWTINDNSVSCGANVHYPSLVMLHVREAMTILRGLSPKIHSSKGYEAELSIVLVFARWRTSPSNNRIIWKRINCTRATWSHKFPEEESHNNREILASMILHIGLS